MPDLIKTAISIDTEMGRLFRQTKWAETRLGPIDEWPRALKGAVGIALSSRYPIVLFWGPELLMLYNDAWRPVLGYKPQFLGKPGKEAWPEIWDIIGPMLKSVLETGVATWIDDYLLVLNRYGYLEEAYFTTSYSAIHLEDGAVGGAFCVVQETTEKVVSARRMTLLKDIRTGDSELESLPVALSNMFGLLRENTKDVPFCALYLSDTTHATLAQSTSDLPSELTPLMVPLDDRFKDSLGKPFDVQHHQVASPAWSDIVRQAIWLPLAGAGQLKPVGYLLLGINPRREFNDEFNNFALLLAAQLASAINSCLAYERELERSKALSELDRSKTVFFNDISHEFRTPLTLMLGPLETLLSRHKDDVGDENELQTILRNSLRLLKLVNTLLDFSRIEAGRYEARFEPTYLGVFTSDLASLFRSTIENAGISFDVSCPKLSEPAYVDRDMWEKIVLNLVSNAFKFTLEGSIRISVRLVDGVFELSVADTGIGIPTDELSTVFRRFHRLKSDGARTYEGSGIGLAMVSELARLHGGEVTVKSEIGKGTEFIVRIPSGYAHLPEEEVFHEARSAEVRHGMAFVQEADNWLPKTQATSQDASLYLIDGQAQQCILVADDNADMRNYLTRILAPFWMVNVVASGREAWNAIQEKPPDMVISDIMMPDMNGFELLHAIRSQEATAHLPVLLLSAKAGEEARAEGIEAGADEYLVKPFSARELYARISRLLQQRTIEQGLETAVRERTEELEAALQAKSRFLSTVSHEVRTPMSAVIGIVELMVLSAEGDMRELAGTALDSCKRLLRILNDLLDASKLQAGAVSLENRLFSIRPVIGDVIQLISPEAGRKQIEVSSKVQTDVPNLICGDEFRVRQVLQNLAFNAVKFTSSGSVSIQVEVVSQKANTTILKFSVDDTGIGLTLEQQKKIFQPFSQAEDSTTRVYGGTGLGLSICRTLVDLMQGDIGVKSEPGKGSHFWVTIPFNGDLCETK